MINIKRFIDRVSMLESKQSKDFVIPMNEARALRDDLAKILLDHFESKTDKKRNDDDAVIRVEVKGGSFK